MRFADKRKSWLGVQQAIGLEVNRDTDFGGDQAV